MLALWELYMLDYCEYYSKQVNYDYCQTLLSKGVMG